MEFVTDKSTPVALAEALSLVIGSKLDFSNDIFEDNKIIKTNISGILLMPLMQAQRFNLYESNAESNNAWTNHFNYYHH